MSTIIVFVLVACSVGCLAYVALPYFNGGARAEQRIEAITKRSASPASEGDAKRKNVSDALNKVAALQSAQGRAPLDIRLQQAGFTITKQAFLAACGAAGVMSALFMVAFTGSIWVAIGSLFVVAAGAPNWVINFFLKKRMSRFTSEFPGALDIITRGVKSGLPLNECLTIIANEAPDPIGMEFQRLVEAQQMGVPLSAAVQKLAVRMPSSEANFFAIAVSIQQKSGGNLAETLSNLARVLRERKQMKQKIAAMSTEATASAAIIACMPPGVALMVYFSSPDYVSLLWTTPTGQVTLLICGFWMGLGILVMRRMINFEI